jgi:D-alanyl-D-alanine carboxypeptidase (penicillin-binding protein 5/6)
MLYSANDACIALAKATCGSESKFLKKMNALARKIGAVNSNFRNTNGMPKNNHYTTAYDLALISAYAMKNPVFRQIVTTRYHRLTINTHKKSKIRKTPRHDFPLAKEIEADHKMPKVRKVKVKNRHKLLGKYSNIRGIKTGYTHAAGRCLSTAWGMHGTEAIVIILNSKNVVDDTLNLLGYHKDMTGMGKYAKR